MTFLLTVIESSRDGKDSVLIKSIVYDNGTAEILEIYQPSPVIVFPRYWGQEMVWRREIAEFGNLGPVINGAVG